MSRRYPQVLTVKSLSVPAIATRRASLQCWTATWSGRVPLQGHIRSIAPITEDGVIAPPRDVELSPPLATVSPSGQGSSVSRSIPVKRPGRAKEGISDGFDCSVSLVSGNRWSRGRNGRASRHVRQARTVHRRYYRISKAAGGGWLVAAMCAERLTLHRQWFSRVGNPTICWQAK